MRIAPATLMPRRGAEAEALVLEQVEDDRQRLASGMR